MLPPKEIMVSVLMITYNHEKYIEEAIRGILMQQVDFSVELLICNDASTDNTNKIIESCILNNSSQLSITYNHRKHNIGMMANFIFGLENCNGKYIALCEGDDYWTDPLKLKRQVNFLEANPDYSICHHAYRVYQEEEKVFLPAVTNDIPLNYGIKLLSKKNTIGTLTVMFRNHFLLPEWFSKLNYGDYPLHLLNACLGKIKYFPEEMAVYRRNHLSVTGSLHSIETPLFLIKSLEILYESLEVDQLVTNNLGLQLLVQYCAVFYYYHSLKDHIHSDFYFAKIRGLKRLFQLMDVNKDVLLQIYLYQIKKYTQEGNDSEIEIIIGDFDNAELSYLLFQYAKEISISNQIKKSTSYRLGNKLVDPIFRILRRIKISTNK